MMWSNGSGGWWLFALPLMIVCVVMMMRMMGHGHGSHTGESHAHRAGGPERILAERLARGEIDRGVRAPSGCAAGDQRRRPNVGGTRHAA